jgi:excisionase family DNA binding protein
MNSTTAKPKPCRSLQPQEDANGPRLLRILEAARYLSSTPWFVRTLIWTKEIPYVRAGKRHLVDRRDLDAYIESVKVR